MILRRHPWRPSRQGQHFFSKVPAATLTDSNENNVTETLRIAHILSPQPRRHPPQPILDLGEALDLPPGTAELLRSPYYQYQVLSTDC